MVRTKRMLRRALDDLNQGIRSLLGPGDARPALVDELLGGRSRERRTPRREPRSASGRFRAPARPRLSRVK
jgi:hypothetical protein